MSQKFRNTDSQEIHFSSYQLSVCFIRRGWSEKNNRNVMSHQTCSLAACIKQLKSDAGPRKGTNHTVSWLLEETELKVAFRGNSSIFSPNNNQAQRRIWQYAKHYSSHLCVFLIYGHTWAQISVISDCIVFSHKPSADDVLGRLFSKGRSLVDIYRE